MITDHYLDKWKWPNTTNPNPPVWVQPARHDFARDWEEFKHLYDRAKKYDAESGQPDCELDEKRQAIKKIADEMGVDIAFL